MLRRTMIAVVAILIAMSAGSVMAQCTVGVYGDADATVGFVQPIEGQNFDVYVVIFAENLISAASYSLDIPRLNVDLFNLTTTYGPSAGGFNLLSVNGENVGLGECAIGFNGNPIVIARHEMLMLPLFFDGPRTISVGGNCDEDCNNPVMSSCNGVISVCDSGATLLVDGVIATQSASFGAVKSLFSN